VISQEWGRISADARRRGRLWPANDKWIAACCLVHGPPLTTFNRKDFEDFAEYEGPVLLTES
jgi:toxin FitB